MRQLLIITLNPPYPLTHGGAIAQYYFLEKLQYYFDVSCIVAVKKKSELETINPICNALPKIKFLFYCQENQNTLLNYSIKFLPFRLVNKLKLKKFFDYKPILNRRLTLFIKGELKKKKYDIVQCEFFELLPILRKLPSDTLKIFIHHELRFKALKNSDFKYTDSYINKIRCLELKQLKNADRVGVFNVDDQKVLFENGINAFMTPFAIPNELVCNMTISKVYDRLIFLGGEGHQPNRDGIFWFLDSIYLPLYNQLLPIQIIGKWSEETINRYSDFEKIDFVGFKENLSSCYKNSIMLVPIKSGSGLRTKVLLAMVNKIPVISTRFGAEGLFDKEKNDHIIFFDNYLEFRALLSEKVNYSEKAQKAFEYYLENFGQEKLLKNRFVLYND